MLTYYKKYPQGYYVYAYLRKKDLTPYYIGKVKRDRAWAKHSFGPPKELHRIIIIQDQLDELSAFTLEKLIISLYGLKINNTGILRNLTKGGSGGDTSMSPNFITGIKNRKTPLYRKKHTTASKEKMSYVKKGKKPPNFTQWAKSASNSSWYYNPDTLHQLRLRKEDPIPAGYLKGNISTSLSNIKKPRNPTPVFCIELNKGFPTVLSAAKFIGLKCPRDIIDCILGKNYRKTAGGYHWKYWVT
jgi:hypothetical protein